MITTSLNMPLPEEPVTEHTPLGEGGIGLDSIKIIELVVRLETNFGVTVPDEQLKQIYDYSIGQLSELIATKAGTP
nr:acyl carrier protein [Paenibacillus curdlanolyticus]